MKVMKEIDFIPQWYKTGRRKRVKYRRQYAVLVGLFIALVLWSFAAGYGVALSQAHVERIRQRIAEKVPIAAEYAQLEAEQKNLVQKKETLERLDQKIGFANILAELSFLVSDNIILQQVSMENKSLQSTASPVKTSYIRLGSSRADSTAVLPDEDLCLVISIEGIAVNANEVAILISKLESSQYFCNVVPGYSRNKDLEQLVATEFEIRCNVANYISRKSEDQL